MSIKNHEKIVVCTCHRKKVGYDKQTDQPVCEVSGLACNVEEVCMYCLGKEVVPDMSCDSETGEWIPDGFKKCICQIDE